MNDEELTELLKELVAACVKMSENVEIIAQAVQDMDDDT